MISALYKFRSNNVERNTDGIIKHFLHCDPAVGFTFKGIFRVSHMFTVNMFNLGILLVIS